MNLRTQRSPGLNLAYLSVILVILIIILLLLVKPVNKIQEPDEITTEQIMLFNGENLEGWDFYVADSTIPPEQVFFINNGMIHITGDPFGYMRTIKAYSGYELHVEWRWTEQPGNSGVFLHITGEDKIFPACIECQLMAGNAGDIILLGGPKLNEQTDTSNIVVPKMEESSEAEPGEWNSYDILSRNDSIIVYVNGVLQNVGTGPSVTEGTIGLQSEGAPIEFRNVYIKK